MYDVNLGFVELPYGNVIYKEMIKIGKKLNFNVKVVKNREIGSLTANGSYSGLRGMMERKEIDVMFDFAQIAADDRYFEHAGTIDEINFVISSVKHEPTYVYEDILSSFLTFDYWTNVYILIAILCFFLIRKLVTENGLTIKMLTNFCNQNYEQNYRRYHLLQKFNYGLWLLFVYFIIHFILGNFKTDLVREVPSPQIETLNDIANNDRLSPIFDNFVAIYTDFENAATPVHQKIWSKCVKNRENCFTDFFNKDLMKKQLINMIEKRFVYIHNEFMIESLKATLKRFCLQNEIFVSQPFASKQIALIMRKGLPVEVKNLAKKVSYAIFERNSYRQIIRKYIKNYVLMTKQKTPNCNEMNIQNNIKIINEENSHQLKLDHLFRTLTMFIGMIATSILIFLIEKIRKYFIF